MADKTGAPDMILGELLCFMSGSETKYGKDACRQCGRRWPDAPKTDANHRRLPRHTFPAGMSPR